MCEVEFFFCAGCSRCYVRALVCVICILQSKPSWLRSEHASLRAAGREPQGTAHDEFLSSKQTRNPYVYMYMYMYKSKNTYTYEGASRGPFEGATRCEPNKGSREGAEAMPNMRLCVCAGPPIIVSVHKTNERCHIYIYKYVYPYTRMYKRKNDIYI